jgi:hypothetical protein
MIEILILAALIVGFVAWRKTRGRRPAPIPPADTPGSYGPDALTGYMKELSVQAQSEIYEIFGAAANPRQQETYYIVGDFLAAMRYYRRAVAAAMSDDVIDAGLGDPGPFIAGFIENYEKTPPNPDRDQAIAVLRHVQTMQGAGVIVGMARLTIDKLRSRGY